MFRDRTNLYVAYRSTFPHHLGKNSVTRNNNNNRFQNMKQEEEGLLHINDDNEGGIELSNMSTEYTNIVQSIENKGNNLTQRIKQNMKLLNKKYKEVLLPQFDDDVIQGEMKRVNELSNNITNELRMIYKVINELQKLDENLLNKEKEDNEIGFKDISNPIKGTRILINNLKKKFAIVSQELSGEFREMQGKYIRYLKKDEFKDNNDNNNNNDYDNNNINVEDYSRNAMVESSKQIESQQSQIQLQINKNELIDDQQYLLEREREIYKISQNVVEISIIFKELENIVIDQGTILDNIEYNIDKASENVKGAHQQLNKAESYQKQTRKCKIVLFLVLLIFLLLMILMVKPKRVDHYVHDSNNDSNNSNNSNSNDVDSTIATTSNDEAKVMEESEVEPTISI
ncbi:hypothetical protein C6P40_001561 [Pichia californica]|uniref:t-SNARE coiled-coil homology domain-containing protein n=1 Tax=Pichia californica TaxID=460514 RepID=A0A9P6WL14_9ASCO|nr:hypothetical protein C6P42_001632 [[Candida] californica]KAG0687973.1 hypothetical protein C6P40_001561 [[Candida] californica]